MKRIVVSFHFHRSYYQNKRAPRLVMKRDENFQGCAKRKESELLMDSRYYPGVEVDAPRLMSQLRNLFDENYQVQTMQVAASTVLQARKESTLRDLTGMSSALTIKVTPEHGGTRVEIGMQRWFDKAALAAVAVILSSGLLLALPALGAYWQHKLTEDAWKIIEDHVTAKAGGYVPPLPGRCGTCGGANGAGSDYCSTCGANMRVGRTCSSCGAVQRDASARYCNKCGKALGSGDWR